MNYNSIFHMNSLHMRDEKAPHNLIFGLILIICIPDKPYFQEDLFSTLLDYIDMALTYTVTIIPKSGV